MDRGHALSRAPLDGGGGFDRGRMARGRDRPETEILPAAQGRPQSAPGRTTTVAHRPRNLDEIMENPTSFDLNRAVQQWRETLAQSPAFRGENLNELESHLSDSIAAWQ